MLFWICLIIGGLFGWLCFKKGLFVAVTMLFNLMIGIYVGVLAAPRVLNMNPEYSQSGNYAAATIFFLAIIIFAVLQLLAWFYLLNDTLEFFPKLIDQVGGAFCGFLFGYFLLGLITLSICVMPFSKGKINEFLPQRDRMIQFAGRPIIRICNFIGAYSLEYFDGQPEVILETLLAVAPDQAPAPAKPKEDITEKLP